MTYFTSENYSGNKYTEKLIVHWNTLTALSIKLKPDARASHRLHAVTATQFKQRVTLFCYIATMLPAHARWRDTSAATHRWRKYSTKTSAGICPTKSALPDIYFNKNVVFEFKGSSLESGGWWSTSIAVFGFSRVNAVKITHLFYREEIGADQCSLQLFTPCAVT